MEAKEAIKVIKNFEPHTLDEWWEANRMAVEALEKQIAKEVTNKFTDLDEEGFEVIFGGCPNCKMEVNFDDNEYCPYCGQRLDWE